MTPAEIRAAFKRHADRQKFRQGRLVNFINQLCLERGIFVKDGEPTARHLEQLWKQARLPAGDLYGKYTSRQIMVMLDPDILEFEQPGTMPPLPRSRHNSVFKVWPAAFTPPPDFKLRSRRSNPARDQWFDALREESIESLPLLGAKLTVAPEKLPNTAQANSARARDHYEREQQARKATRQQHKPWVSPDDVDAEDGEIQDSHPDFRIARELARKFKNKYRHSDYDDLLQRANVVLLDEKEYLAAGHKNRQVSIATKINRRLTRYCIEESRRRQIFGQPPKPPKTQESDEFEDRDEWTECTAKRWAPRPDRASRVAAVLRTGKLSKQDWRIWKMLRDEKSNVEIASALGLSSHDVVYRTKEKIKKLLKRDWSGAQPAASRSPSFNPPEQRKAPEAPEPSPFELAIIDAIIHHPSRGEVRNGRSWLLSGSTSRSGSAIAHTLHCLTGGGGGAGCSGAGCSKDRIDELGLEFVDVRYFRGEVCVTSSGIWELHPKAAGS